MPDPEFGKKQPCSAFRPPAQNLGPHVAALGMRFYTGTQFPAAYRNRIFIAEHGSWNRSRKIGYRVTMVTLDGDKAVRYEPFVEGWLQGEQAWGRPADVLVAPDGSLLVSDDSAGAIYRIRYRGRAGALSCSGCLSLLSVASTRATGADHDPWRSVVRRRIDDRRVHHRRGNDDRIVRPVIRTSDGDVRPAVVAAPVRYAAIARTARSDGITRAADGNAPRHVARGRGARGEGQARPQGLRRRGRQ